MSDQPPEIPGGAQLRTIAMPRDTNAGGSIFGGWTLSQMEAVLHRSGVRAR
jgi:acyl-CoA thioesterase YciA